MKICEYGTACNRADCIYRHDNVASKTDEVCLQFLAGTCAFGGGGCRKRHPPKDEKDRLLKKYKRIRCHFGDDCRTGGCLYLHPREMRPIEPAYIEPVNMDVAFPALSATTNSTKKPSGPKTEPLPPSPWNRTVMQPPQPMIQQQNIMPMNHHPQPEMSNMPMVAPAWFPHQDPSFAPFCPPVMHHDPHYGGAYDGYGDDGGGYGYPDDGYYGGYEYGPYDGMGAGGEMPAAPPSANFNVGAKEFVPGGFSS